MDCLKHVGAQFIVGLINGQIQLIEAVKEKQN